MKKIMALTLIFVIVVSLTLFVTGGINALQFFIVAAIIGIIAFKVIPKMKH